MADRGGRGGQRGGGRGGNPSRGAPGGRGGAQQNRRGGPAGRGGGAGGGAKAGGGGASSSAADRPKKEAILDLAKYVDKKVRVKFTGGREGEAQYEEEACVSMLMVKLVIGLLKGYDQLMNLVMDEVEEYLRDPSSGDLTEKTRPLGLAVIRGTALTVINPADGFGQISNPFLAPE